MVFMGLWVCGRWRQEGLFDVSGRGVIIRVVRGGLVGVWCWRVGALKWGSLRGDLLGLVLRGGLMGRQRWRGARDGGRG